MNYKHFSKYSNDDRKTIEKLFLAGASDDEIGHVIGRTGRAIAEQRLKQGLKYRNRQRMKPSQVAPPKGAKYTRYLKPKTEFSILWGLIKFTKA